MEKEIKKLKEKIKALEKENADKWRDGYDAGMKQFLRNNQKAMKIGEVIMEVMYDTFETTKEDY